ncbi:MAG TPA: SDR family NAD(P)-dependent oxidoreductase [Anaerolineales bacterium]|nr:SDR family NAD(P)-dependent oxidoreductase [Anaerolineales bacterium]
MYRYEDHTVVISGASGNLGVAIARKFQENGAHLVLVDRSPGRLQKIFPDLVDSREHFLADGVDANDATGVQQALHSAVDRFEAINVLVNTIGGYRGGNPTHETSEETWDFIFQLNTRPAFILSRAVVPLMLENGSGKIIHIAARAGVQGGAGMAPYSAAKSGVIRLTEGLAAELKEYGINVNCILPGRIDTPQNRLEMPGADYSRWVTPEVIADVVLFLASEAARGVNGAAIPVYGKS